MVSPTYYARLRAMLSLLQPGALALDAGCGMGEAMLQLSLRGVRSVGVDIETADLLRARESLRALRCDFDLVRADVTSLPFRDSAFTSAVCLEVLQYLDDDRACLREIDRVLIPGRSMVVSVPSRDFPVLYDPFNWILARLDIRPVRVGIWFWGDQLRLYSSRNLLNLLAEVGLKASKVRFVGTWLIPLLESYASSLLYSLMRSSEKPAYMGKRTTSPRGSSSVRRRLGSLSAVLSFLAGLDERPGIPVGTHILVSATKPDQAHL